MAPSLDAGTQVRVGNFVKPRKLELHEDLELVHESVKPSSVTLFKFLVESF